MSLPAAQAPRILAAGERQVSASTHVGYLVSFPGIRYDGSAAMAPLLLAYVSLPVLVLALSLLLWRPRLWRWYAVPALAFVVWGAWMQSRWTADRPYLEAMALMERFLAEIEAEAARTGTWPDLAQWSRAHRSTEPSHIFEFTAQRRPTTRPEPWAALSVRATNVNQEGRRFLDGFPRTPMDSRLFGPDGLYGTRDDDSRLVHALSPWRQRDTDRWPHGRTARDPAVKLPDWPKEAPQ